MGKLLKLVLTGGPCAGKTTSIERLKDFLSSRGYCVLRIPEAATLTMGGGIYFSPEMSDEFQTSITSIQKNNEEVFFKYAKQLAAKKDCDVVILMDRGLIDGAAYVPMETFENLLVSVGMGSVRDVMDRYDVVFFLDSAALGAEKFYTMCETRFESVEKAIEVNKNTRRVWESHKNFKVFDNIGKSFEKKMREIVSAVCDILEISVTMKIPQRYIIDFCKENIPSEIRLSESKVEKIFISPNTEILTRMDNRDEKEFSFVRKISSNKSTSFVLKTVQLAADQQQIEMKEHLTERQYNLYLRFADPTRQKVVQTRFYFTLEGVKYEICRYENVEVSEKGKLTLLNVFRPLSEANESVVLPHFLRSKEDVTRNFKYSSHYLSLLDKSKTYSFVDLYRGESVKCRIVQGEFDYE